MSQIVVPRVRPAKSCVLIVVISAAMKRVRAALCHNLYLAACTSVKVGGLVRRGYLELLNARHRDRNHGRRRLCESLAVIRPGSTRGVRTERRDVRVVVATHVVSGESTIQLERVLVAGCPAHVAVEVLA